MPVQINVRKLAMIYSMTLLLVFVAEFALFIWVARVIGWWSLLIVVATSVLGLLFIRRETRKAWDQLRESMATGVPPVGDGANRLLVFVGGMLLLMPGFIGNLVGLLLVIAPSRSLFRGLLARFGTRLGTQPRDDVITGVVVDESDDVHEGRVLPPAREPGEEPR